MIKIYTCQNCDFLDSDPNFVKNWGGWEVVFSFFFFSFFFDCLNEQNSPERNI